MHPLKDSRALPAHTSCCSGWDMCGKGGPSRPWWSKVTVAVQGGVPCLPEVRFGFSRQQRWACRAEPCSCAVWELRPACGHDPSCHQGEGHFVFSLALVALQQVRVPNQPGGNWASHLIPSPPLSPAFGLPPRASRDRRLPSVRGGRRSAPSARH